MSNTIATVSAAGSAVAAIIAIALVYLQLRTQNRQLRQAALISLHEEILQLDIQRAIRFVYGAKPEDLAEPKSAIELEQIELVLNRYDLIGGRLQYGVIPEKETLQTEWPVVLRLHAQLERFIAKESALRGPDTPYKPGFSWLVKACLTYRDKHHPTSRPQAFKREYSPTPTTEISLCLPTECPRIVFISGHTFGRRALQGMLQSAAFLKGAIRFSLIVTVQQSERLATAGVASLADIAQERCLPHLFVRSVKTPQCYAQVRDVRPDYIIAIGLSELLPRALLDVPREIHSSALRHGADHGAIGMHPTLLPEGRGRAPIPWTILKGLRKTGLTTFFLEEDADSGSIIAQTCLDVDSDETATSLYEKVCDRHREAGTALADTLASGSVNGTPQNEARASYWPRRRPADSEFYFDLGAEGIERLVRAQSSPYPSAYFTYRDRPVLVHRVSVVGNEANDHPGYIRDVSSDGTPVIDCTQGAISLDSYDAPDGLIFEKAQTIGPPTHQPAGS